MNAVKKRVLYEAAALQALIQLNSEILDNDFGVFDYVATKATQRACAIADMMMKASAQAELERHR